MRPLRLGTPPESPLQDQVPELWLYEGLLRPLTLRFLGFLHQCMTLQKLPSPIFVCIRLCHSVTCSLTFLLLAGSDLTTDKIDAIVNAIMPSKHNLISSPISYLLSLISSCVTIFCWIKFAHLNGARLQVGQRVLPGFPRIKKGKTRPKSVVQISKEQKGYSSLKKCIPWVVKSQQNIMSGSKNRASNSRPVNYNVAVMLEIGVEPT